MTFALKSVCATALVLGTGGALLGLATPAAIMAGTLGTFQGRVDEGRIRQGDTGRHQFTLDLRHRVLRGLVAVLLRRHGQGRVGNRLVAGRDGVRNRLVRCGLLCCEPLDLCCCLCCCCCCIGLLP